MDIMVFHSGNCGNAQNCKYPYSGIGSTPEELKKLFCYDHTFIRFKNNYRSKENFLEATIAALDNDNDHSDDPKDWVGILDIPKLFPNVPCIKLSSRHSLLVTGIPRQTPIAEHPLSLLRKSATTAEPAD